MWLELEGGVLINLDMVERVVPRHHEQTVSLYGGGVTLCADSKLAWQYFENVIKKDNASFASPLAAR